MSRQLIDHNEDLRRLRDDGFNVDIVGAHLVIRDVPYVTSDRRVNRGILMCRLNLAGDLTQPPDNHQMWFQGEYPCDETGNPLGAIEHSAGGDGPRPDLMPNFGFSAKPIIDGTPSNYADYYHQVVTYVGHLEGPAQQLDAEVDARTHALHEVDPADQSPFRYLDTASGRAGISSANRKLALSSVAIVGLGGTGAYVLDLIAKAPVKAIHLWDPDVLLSHNAYRAPGAAALTDLRERPFKVHYLQGLYDRMRTGITAHAEAISGENIDQLTDLDFVFLCIDDSDARGPIVDALERAERSFIDVGLGADVYDEMITATLRVSTSTPNNRAELRKNASFESAGRVEIYGSNIQVADLNSLNAAMAVLRWKKLCGFYRDYNNEHHLTYTVATNLLDDGRAPDED